MSATACGTAAGSNSCAQSVSTRSAVRSRWWAISLSARCSPPAISASRIAEAGIRPEAYDPKLGAGFAPPREQDLTPADFGEAA